MTKLPPAPAIGSRSLGSGPDSMERPELIEFGGHEYLVNEGLAPAEARAALRTDVLDSLARAGVYAFAVRGPSVARSRIGIMESERTRALEALASGLTGPATYLEEIYPEYGQQSLRRLAQGVRRLPCHVAARSSG